MNFATLKSIFENNTGVSSNEVESAELAFWFNEAQLDLAYELGPLGSYEYTAVADTTYDLPADALKITGCTGNYSIDGAGKIEFENEGENILYYRGMPTDFTGLDAEESELHKALHYLLPIFAGARYWDKESEGDPEEMNLANKWLSMYYQGKAHAINKLSVITGASTPRAWTIE